MAYQEQDGIPRSPGLHSLRLGYLTDDEYRDYKTGWRLHQNMEPLSPEQEDFGSFVRQTQDVAKDEGAVSE